MAVLFSPVPLLNVQKRSRPKSRWRRPSRLHSLVFSNDIRAFFWPLPVCSRWWMVDHGPMVAQHQPYICRNVSRQRQCFNRLNVYGLHGGTGAGSLYWSCPTTEHEISPREAIYGLHGKIHLRAVGCARHCIELQHQKAAEPRSARPPIFPSGKKPDWAEEYHDVMAEDVNGKNHGQQGHARTSDAALCVPYARWKRLEPQQFRHMSGSTHEAWMILFDSIRPFCFLVACGNAGGRIAFGPEQ
eukprot:s831_g11.t1